MQVWKIVVCKTISGNSNVEEKRRKRKMGKSNVEEERRKRKMGKSNVEEERRKRKMGKSIWGRAKNEYK